MPTINVRTTQNVLISYQVAGVWDRILAFCIDCLIFIAYLIVIVVLMTQLKLTDNWMFIAIYLPIFFYNLLFEILMNGQTPGKIAMDLKVVRLDGESPTILNYIFRFILWPVDILFAGSVAITFILLTSQGQRLGDLAGGTTVVKTKNLTSHARVQLLKNTEPDYIPLFPQIATLSDHDIKLIKEALRVNVELGNDEPMLILNTKIKTMLGIQSDLPPVNFLYAVIKEYQQLTSSL
jgi:uncharacterized RDD family membrane protein YckC